MYIYNDIPSLNILSHARVRDGSHYISRAHEKELGAKYRVKKILIVI